MLCGAEALNNNASQICPDCVSHLIITLTNEGYSLQVIRAMLGNTTTEKLLAVAK